MAEPERPARGPAAAAVAPVVSIRPLTTATLGQHGTRLTVPTYDRSALVPAVVHLSVGGFSRAHQLIYFDEVAERRISTGWGVVGVGLRHRLLQEALAPQDNLYTVVERSPDGERARVVGVLTDYLFAPDDPTAVLDRLADPRTRLVTMTITGAGYLLDPSTGAFTPDDDVRHDLDRPDAPRTVFGFLVEALDRRRRAGTPPFTVVSCDNLHRNGDATRAAVVGFAAGRDEVLARWIADRVAFPSSMVDRITPQTTPEERAAVAERHGVDDRWPVVTEPFSQWVIEDTFCHGRPPLDRVGVRFVRDVTEHELMKTRLLNATHSALGYLGTLAGHERIDELVADPVFAGYATVLMDDEVTPLIPCPEGIDLDEYKATLMQRFANPAIADRLSRLCRRGSTKLPHHLLPSLRQALAEGRPHALLTLAVAGWVRYLQRADDLGRPLPVEDDRGPTLQALALAGGTDPRPLLSDTSVFGDLGTVPGFADELEGVLRRMARDGLRATVASAVAATVAARPAVPLAPALPLDAR
ncbi:fructuronate reductase/mannitol 2-dehydrogenase [Geodermatophilus tzadiensis]|uniref:Mannitol-1-phosphate 5-dehydrogenase n=1 Tax=Geodermatophilus tzadiensis TaxID=1137988 RepID=A0A2T0TZT5_9ACTN|nr:mannitol dehydrogenase family protein [Geodermatophilus tzadiensis]PRY51169.1 fructuronate reductase/mannitol 2-dehydrogenase [Geodermatophilus tzadiensis]